MIKVIYTFLCFFQLQPSMSDINLEINYKTSREKFDRAGMRTRIAQVVELRARDPEGRGSNPGSSSNFSPEIL